MHDMATLYGTYQDERGHAAAHVLAAHVAVLRSFRTLAVLELARTTDGPTAHPVDALAPAIVAGVVPWRGFRTLARHPSAGRSRGKTQY